MALARCWAPFFAEPGRLPREQEFAIGQLQMRAALTSDTAAFLVSELKLWDAEILMRAVMEATVKVVFLCIGAPEERAERSHDFMESLRDIASIRRHRRVRAALERVADPDAPEWRPLRDLLLPEKELRALTEAYPRDKQIRIEGRWGFTQIAEAFGRKGGKYADLPALLHSYGNASHHVHMDADAILMMWEREKREPHRIVAIELAHGAKLIGDGLAFAALRCATAYEARGLELEPVLEVIRASEELQDELTKAEENWHAIEYAANL